MCWLLPAEACLSPCAGCTALTDTSLAASAAVWLLRAKETVAMVRAATRRGSTGFPITVVGPSISGTRQGRVCLFWHKFLGQKERSTRAQRTPLALPVFGGPRVLRDRDGGGRGQRPGDRAALPQSRSHRQGLPLTAALPIVRRASSMRPRGAPTRPIAAA